MPVKIVDRDERRRIYEGLARFRHLHNGIGVPTLYDHIVNKLDPFDVRKLKVKSLQRFIETKGVAELGEGRVNDEAVWVMKKFLQNVTPPLSDDEKFAAALHRFFPTVHTWQMNMESFTGTYLTRVYPSSRWFDDDETQDDPHVPYSIVTLKPSKAENTLLASETVYNPSCEPRDLPDDPAYSLSGVFISFTRPHLLLTVRNFWDTRTYVLDHSPRSPNLTGYALASGDEASTTARQHSVSYLFDVILLKQDENPSD